MEGAGAAAEQPPAPHPAVAPLSFLLGKWRGEGEGSFPTISPFRYGEELLFSHHPSKPVISYMQRTWKAASGEPMHAESGYWRPRPDGSIEVVISQSTGLAEVQPDPSPNLLYLIPHLNRGVVLDPDRDLQLWRPRRDPSPSSDSADTGTSLLPRLHDHPALSFPAIDVVTVSNHPMLEPPSELDRCITTAMELACQRSGPRFAKARRA
ncbi:hypothetical protein E2562_014621 [Oryza meyeriana var. granulata]|uniref:THAP4-like heme-binding domain-containing protein n=1 Tax=Oryza meyeriana var. granulata TaxID=110450 RepID=A0A6G1DXE7_9ORYZ|nr:hypothetical protein E2562_014621 [Oryza meyeriana var. granulata]